MRLASGMSPRTALVLGLVLIVFAVAAGVGWYRFTSKPIDSRAPASNAADPVWGPLVVVDFDSGAAALSAGTVGITDRCVFLTEPGNVPSVLVWYDRRTRWQVTAHEVVLENRDGTEATIRDGDQVTLSGGGSSDAEGGASGEQWVASIDWVARPDPSCPTASRWFVNEVLSPR